MPLPNIPLPAFPNVPALPGVPQLLRAPGAVVNNAFSVALTQDAASVIGLLLQNVAPTWGIYDASGFVPIFLGLTDTTLGLSSSREFRISDATVELGGFVSYNRVAVPRNCTVRTATGGPLYKRQALLLLLDSYIESTTLFTVVQPEGSIKNLNIVKYDYGRAQMHGAGMLDVDIRLEEVRQSGAVAFSNTASPGSAAPVNGGAVQPQAPTQAQGAGIMGGVN